MTHVCSFSILSYILLIFSGGITTTDLKDTLITMVGTEPQVVTLLFDALIKNGFPIGEVVVLHTNPSVVDIYNSVNRLEKELASEEGITLRFVPIKSNDRFPKDICCDEDATLLLRVLYTTVLKIKKSHRRIHLSIAGGRKVMAAYGMLVAQLLFDDNDHVWHILSERSLLESRAMRNRDVSQISLINVPVLRWTLLPSTLQELLLWNDPYKAIVKQKELQEHTKISFLAAFWHGLTRTEKQLLEVLVKTGGTNKEIARRLYKSPKTISNQLQSIYDKYASHTGISRRSGIRNRLISDLAPFMDSLRTIS